MTLALLAGTTGVVVSSWCLTGLSTFLAGFDRQDIALAFAPFFLAALITFGTILTLLLLVPEGRS